MAAVNGYSSNYSYGYGYDSYQNSKINSSSWTENAEQAANKMKEDLGISTSESSSTAKATSSASTYLIEYQRHPRRRSSEATEPLPIRSWTRQKMQW